jgi:hypothetical protein
MHTCDLVREMLNLDEGRWRTAGTGGREIDEYYLREGLRKLLPTEGLYSEIKSRRWRANPKSNQQYGYHELHLADAFSRYLGKGLPSEASPESDEDEDDSASNPRSAAGQQKAYASSNGGDFPDSSDPSDPTAETTNKSDSCNGSDENALSDPEKSAIYQQPTAKETDGSDESGIWTPKKKDVENKQNTFTNLPRGPVGRRRARP